MGAISGCCVSFSGIEENLVILIANAHPLAIMWWVVADCLTGILQFTTTEL